jgi:hypothetical protein
MFVIGHCDFSGLGSWVPGSVYMLQFRRAWRAIRHIFLHRLVMTILRVHLLEHIHEFIMVSFLVGG